MRAWEQRTPFLDLLSEDPAVTAHLSRDELEALFDYNFYLQHVDASFRRLGYSRLPPTSACSSTHRQRSAS